MFLEISIDLNHCHFNQICSSPLQRSINSQSFSSCSYRRIFAVDFWNGALPACERDSSSSFASAFSTKVKEFFYFCVAFEISMNELVSFSVVDAQLLRKAKGLLTI